MKRCALVPKKFLCKFPLEQGAFNVGILMLVVMVICVISSAIQLVYVGMSQLCDSNSMRNAYAYNILAVIYSIFMLFVSIWFLWGVQQKKPSVIMGYLVVSTMWLAQILCLLITLICLYSSHVSFVAWLLILILGLVAIAMLAYCLLSVLGYWYELKEVKTRQIPESS